MRRTDTHSEKWTITLELEPADCAAGFRPWPDTQLPWGPFIRPDTIRIELRRGECGPDFKATGPRVLKNGEMGTSRHDAFLLRFWRKEEPEPWAEELCRRERETRGLTPEKTGVPW